MSTASCADPSSSPPPRTYSPLAGLLSYLVPGLGQIYEGRVGKGILFLVCLYGLFFYGMYLGNWSNVNLYYVENPNPGRFDFILNKFRFSGQFPIGIVAWPAIYQYHAHRYHDGNPGLPYEDPNTPFLQRFQRVPDEKILNEMQRNGDKSWDLGMIYTVIAGVLNILVIYDAFAGPAFIAPAQRAETPKQEAAPS